MDIIPIHIVGIDWATWFGGFATILVVLVALFRNIFFAPKFSFIVESNQPFLRDVGPFFWIRLMVKNVGRAPARNCIIKLSRIETAGKERIDKDPLQLRWAGVPDKNGFDPIHLGLEQKEFINLVSFHKTNDSKGAISIGQAQIATWGDFSPGFSLFLEPSQEHICEVTIYSDNAKPFSTRISFIYEAARQDTISCKMVG